MCNVNAFKFIHVVKKIVFNVIYIYMRSAKGKQGIGLLYQNTILKLFN